MNKEAMKQYKKLEANLQSLVSINEWFKIRQDHEAVETYNKLIIETENKMKILRATF